MENPQPGYAPAGVAGLCISDPHFGRHLYCLRPKGCEPKLRQFASQVVGIPLSVGPGARFGDHDRRV